MGEISAKITLAILFGGTTGYIVLSDIVNIHIDQPIKSFFYICLTVNIIYGLVSKIRKTIKDKNESNKGGN
jgi:hypothetical protein